MPYGIEGESLGGDNPSIVTNMKPFSYLRYVNPPCTESHATAYVFRNRKVQCPDGFKPTWDSVAGYYRCVRSTDANPPKNCGSGGGGGGGPDCGGSGNNNFGNPFNVALGNKFDSETDYDAPGPGVEYPDGTAKIYHYERTDLPNHLTGISFRDTSGTVTRYATYDYDTSGRTTLSQHADVGNGGPQEVNTVRYAYPTYTYQTTVTDAARSRWVTTRLAR